MRCHHYCNTVNCATCIQAFWRWAENYTQGRGWRAESRSRVAGGVTFYEKSGGIDPQSIILKAC